MRKRFGLRTSIAGFTVLAAAAALLVFFAVGALATGGGTGCPSLSGKQVSPDVGAYFNDNGSGNATYYLNTPNDSPSGNVPGLIQYCVLTSPVPDSATADYAGWTATLGTLDFAYSRNVGTNNIPFDGTQNVDVGNATWNSGTVPDASAQTIILHISDSAECNALYSDGSQTCWVFPSGGTTTTAADLQVSKTATPSFTRTYGWTVDKSTTTPTVYTAGGASGSADYSVSVGHDSGTDSGWQVTGTITVTNPNGFDVAVTGVTDQIDNNADSCTVQDGTVEGTGGATGIDPTSGTIPANGAVDFPYTCSYSSAPDPASGFNTATATWSATGQMDGTSGTASSDPMPYDFSTTTPSVVNGCVQVNDTDPAGPQGTEVCVGDDNPTVIDYSGTVTGDAGTCTPNTDTASIGTVPVGDSVSAELGSDQVTVSDCQGADLSVSKTATAAFNRTYDWSVLKKQTTSSTPITSSASSVTVGYKVTTTWSGPTDSGWQVTGTITVSNPNDWESVTLTGVSDSIDNGGTCSINASDVANETATLAPKGTTGDSTTLGYTCTYTSAPSPAAGTNTATATWDATAASTPDGTNSGTKGVNFSTVTPTVTHDTTTVKDAFNGGTALTLGVAKIDGTFVKDSGNNLANWGTPTYNSTTKTFTFTYTRSVTVPTDTCKEYDNTATISDDATSGDNSSSASVVVCPKVNGFTMGYWQNKNGQGQINGGNPTGTCQPLYAYLTQFNPFKDIPNNTCGTSAGYTQNKSTVSTGIAGYVYNVIKAANASGASMNAMLKAQMLATALSVYFSTTSLGTIHIDLTKICNMIDNTSTGTGTCGTGGYLTNVGNAFITSGTLPSTPDVKFTSLIPSNPLASGGCTTSTAPTSMSVECLLWNAASWSNSGGTSWYPSNNKTTQGLAKNTFDAINNSVAVAAGP